MIKGIPVSRGIVVARALQFVKTEMALSNRMIAMKDVPLEKARVSAGVQCALAQIAEMREALDDSDDDTMAELIDVQEEMLQDPTLLDKIDHYIEFSLNDALDATIRATVEISDEFAKMDNEYLRARAADVKDVGERLLLCIQGRRPKDLSRLSEEVVLFAEDLAPSDTITMDKAHVLGFVTRQGSQTSHTAILARILEIPAIVGADFQDIRDGDLVVLDALAGEVLANPNEQVVAEYRERAARFHESREKLKLLKDLPAETPDGRHVHLFGNISEAAEIAKIDEAGGTGVGLFRTEFLFMNSRTLPDEETQYAVYREAAVKAKGRPVIIRTLDIGGDKHVESIEIPKEENPFLGYRAIRICLDQPGLFKTQLRALLRAGVHGEIRIMFPMICSRSELVRAKKMIADVKAELAAEGTPFRDDMKVGMMVEIPSVAAAADVFAKMVDFFSIGTNDLIQYTLAVDRMNPKIASLYNPFNPGVLRLIANTIREGKKAGIEVGMCGEMAGDPKAAKLLLGLGLDEFSMSASSIPQVKDIIRGVTLAEAEKIAAHVLTMDSAMEIAQYLEEN